MEHLINDTELEIINDLAQLELTASHSYLFLANCMRSKGYFGAEKFFTKESLSEREHYNKWAMFLNNLGVEINVDAVDSVDKEIANLTEAMEMALDMEQSLLKEYEVACCKDVSMKVKLEMYDFVKIQVESVGEYLDLLARLEITKEEILVDQELK